VDDVGGLLGVRLEKREQTRTPVRQCCTAVEDRPIAALQGATLSHPARAAKVFVAH